MKATIVTEQHGALMDNQGNPMTQVANVVGPMAMRRDPGASGSVMVLNGGDDLIGVVVASVKPGHFHEIPASVAEFMLVEQK